MSKNLLFFVVFAFLQGCTFSLLAQSNNLFYDATYTHWQCRTQQSINANPTTFDMANSGSWVSAIEANFPWQCAPTGLTMPGVPITYPGYNVCDGATGIGAYTSTFYRTMFNFPLPLGACSAILKVRADNGFRVYVDGNVVPGTMSFNSASFCSPASMLNGNNQNVATPYEIDLRDFLSTAADGNHTVILEVLNCDYITYVSASMRIVAGVNPNPNFTWTLSGNSGGGPLALDLNAIFNGWSHHSWLVESAESENGPWQTLFTTEGFRVFKLFQNVHLDDIPRGVYIRVTHCVRIDCANGVTTVCATQTIPTGAHFNGGGGEYMMGMSHESYLPMAATEDDKRTSERSNLSYAMSHVGVFPNPNNGLFSIENLDGALDNAKILDLTGKVVKSITDIPKGEPTFQIDCTEFQQGTYFLNIYDQQHHVLANKKLVIIK